MRPELKEKLAGRRVVASISGGKDSAAMSLWLTEQGIEHDRVFMDTGWEHPATYEYLRGPLAAKLGQITEIRGPLTMEQVIEKHGAFPSRKWRFCTRELKVEPLQRYLASLGEEAVNAVGVRAEESEARARMPEWEWSDALEVETWRPLLGWSFEDVRAIHNRHGLAPNPLYLWGAERVGCWPCINARKAEIRLIADVDPGRFVRLADLEERISAAAGASRSWFQARLEHPDGNYPPWPIKKVIEWSRTSHGGRQFELFAAEPRDAGCMRWGLCDTGEESK